MLEVKLSKINVSIPYREGTTRELENLGNAITDAGVMIVSIPYREGTTEEACEKVKKLASSVSIPYREGTTTAFTPFVIAIIHQTPHFCNVFLKKVGRSPFLKV